MASTMKPADGCVENCNMQPMAICGSGDLDTQVLVNCVCYSSDYKSAVSSCAQTNCPDLAPQVLAYLQQRCLWGGGTLGDIAPSTSAPGAILTGGVTTSSTTSAEITGASSQLQTLPLVSLSSPGPSLASSPPSTAASPNPETARLSTVAYIGIGIGVSIPIAALFFTFLFYRDRKRRSVINYQNNGSVAPLTSSHSVERVEMHTYHEVFSSPGLSQTVQSVEGPSQRTLVMHSQSNQSSQSVIQERFVTPAVGFDPPPTYDIAGHEPSRGHLPNPGVLAVFANANRDLISEDLEERLVAAGYLPTNDPDNLSEEEWRIEHNVTKLELIRLRTLYHSERQWAEHTANPPR